MVISRTKLLNADEKAAKQIPSFGQLLGEVKNATFSGKIIYNALNLSEEAANKFFGETQTPANAGLIRRVWNLNSKINKGMKDLTWQQLSMAGGMAKDMAYGRIDQTKQGLYSRADSIKRMMTPMMTRIGQTPIIPNFVYRTLRSGDSSSMAPQSAGLRTGTEDTKGKATEGTTKATTVPEKQKINVNVNVVAPEAAIKTETKTFTEKGAIGNTNAQGLGQMGEAGMGVTTTGAEVAGEHQEFSVPPTEGGESGGKKKKHSTKM